MIYGNGLVNPDGFTQGFLLAFNAKVTKVAEYLLHGATYCCAKLQNIDG